MWAQLVKFRVPADKVDQLQQLDERWNDEVGRTAGSGWVRSVTLQRQSDPSEWYELVFFESEEKARANEKTAKHLALVEEMQAAGKFVDFVDLTVVKESSR
jgi:hypothetical protein